MDFESLIKRKDKDLNKYKKAINELIDQLHKIMEADILMFYHKYYKDGKSDLSEAFKMLSNNEFEEFKLKAKKYYKQAMEAKFDGKQLWNESYTKKLGEVVRGKKIQRIESVLLELEYLITQINEYEKIETAHILNKTYKEAFLNSAYEVSKKLNIGVSLDEPSSNVILKTIFEDWTSQGDIFNLIDVANESLIKVLKKELLIGLSLGENPRTIARRLEQKTNITKRRAELIARTETTRIVNEASYEGIKALEKKLGFTICDKYEILATLDDRTSDICQELDGKVFNFKDRKVGINFPPLHPNCRSTYIFVFDDEDNNIESDRISKRLDDGSLEYVSSKITYKEWEKKFVTLQ